MSKLIHALWFVLFTICSVSISVEYSIQPTNLMSLPNEILSEVGYQMVGITECGQLHIEVFNNCLKNLTSYSQVNRRLWGVTNGLLEGIIFRERLRSLLIERSFTLHHAMIGACMHNLVLTARLVLRYKPEPKTNPLLFCSYDGKGYLHYAALFNATDVLSLLLSKEKSMSVNTQDNDGNTPLHATVENISVEAARILLGNGADVFAKNKYGMTPFDMTYYRKKKQEDNRERLIMLKTLFSDKEKEVSLMRSVGHHIKREIKQALS